MTSAFIPFFSLHIGQPFLNLAAKADPIGDFYQRGTTGSGG